MQKTCNISLSVEIPYKEMERLGSWLPYAIWLGTMLRKLNFFGMYWERLQHPSLILVLGVTVHISLLKALGRSVALRFFKKNSGFSNSCDTGTFLEALI